MKVLYRTYTENINEFRSFSNNYFTGEEGGGALWMSRKKILKL